MSVKKRSIAVVGLGHVGAHVAFTLGVMGIADEVLLCDKKEDKLVSERQDLMDAVKFMPHRVNYKIAKYEELSECDVLINCIGDIKLCATGNRDDEMNFTVVQVADYIPKVMAGGFHGIIINVTNPCDVITHLIAKLSGLPQGHVFGTGTGLDSSRLVSAISQQTGLDPNSFTAYMMGEHGNAQMVPWSLIAFGGKKLSDMATDAKFVFDKEDIQKKTINAGWVTYHGKQCTEYGICCTAATLAKAVLRDEKKITAVSAPLTGEYGEAGIFCGVPAVVGINGVEQVMEYPLPEQELTEFKECCAKIRANITKASKLL
ncbi:MAG: L-lactate dehydrogenase [Acidaminococcaceae bacterium]|nr:L-lactate dehydrogenase [Acidaminococcaceae bacterium]